MKTLKFRPDDVIIYDVSGDFEILFSMWDRLVMSYVYTCAKFHCHPTIITCNTFIFHVCFLYFSQNDIGFRKMTSLYVTSK